VPLGEGVQSQRTDRLTSELAEVQHEIPDEDTTHKATVAVRFGNGPVRLGSLITELEQPRTGYWVDCGQWP
jgi:hypothetical protein